MLAALQLPIEIGAGQLQASYRPAAYRGGCYASYPSGRLFASYASRQLRIERKTSRGGGGRKTSKEPWRSGRRILSHPFYGAVSLRKPATWAASSPGKNICPAFVHSTRSANEEI